MRHWLRVGPALLAAGLLWAAAWGCRTRLYEFADCTVQVNLPQVETTCRQQEKNRNKVDVLFMIDNSTSMDAMQDELRQRFSEFLRVFHDLAAQGTYVDLQIGVVTSDYGAGKSGTGNCEPSPGGQKGKLQALGQFAKAGCQPPMGASFLKYTFDPGAGAGANNLPPGQTLDDTFTCMASVGARGCGAEHQLESVYAALHNDLPENKGFLREDAILAVVFLTNEDDCSAPPDTDLFDENLVAKYGQNYSYRCTRFGILCGSPPVRPPYESSHGPLAMCVSAPNVNGMGPGKLYDIGRYVDFFSKPGGVKFDPADVLLVGIDALETPFEIILAQPGTGNDGKPYLICPALMESGNPPCVPTLQHSCLSPTSRGFFGDPSVRLNAVIASAANHAVTSICDANYTASLKNVAKLIVSQLGQCCLPERLPPDPRTPGDPNTFIADCMVQEITRENDGTTTTTEIPQCAAQSGFPCWRIDRKDQCTGLSPQSFGITIERNGAPTPPHTTANATCTTQK